MPKAADVRVDKLMSAVAVGYGPQTFSAEAVAPVVSVSEQGGLYFEYGREELVAHDDRRAPGAESTEIQWDVSQKSYWCNDYALKQILPDKIRDQSDLPVSAQVTSVQKITEILKLNYEKRVKAIAQGSGVHTTAAVNKWNAAAADPDANAQAVREVIRKRVGVYPNCVLIAPAQRDALINYLKTKATMTYGDRATINELPAIMWGCRVICPTPVENTANPEQTAVIADIWSTTEVLFFYAGAAPSVMNFSFMYTIRYQPWSVNRWRADSRKGEFFEVEVGQTEKLICADCGERLTGVL